MYMLYFLLLIIFADKKHNGIALCYIEMIATEVSIKQNNSLQNSERVTHEGSQGTNQLQIEEMPPSFGLFTHYKRRRTKDDGAAHFKAYITLSEEFDASHLNDFMLWNTNRINCFLLL